MESEKLQIGDKVKFKDLDKPIGIIKGIAVEPVLGIRDNYCYYVEWDHGNIGMPSGDSIEKIKTENHLTVFEDATREIISEFNRRNLN